MLAQRVTYGGLTGHRYQGLTPGCVPLLHAVAQHQAATSVHGCEQAHESRGLVQGKGGALHCQHGHLRGKGLSHQGSPAYPLPRGEAPSAAAGSGNILPAGIELSGWSPPCAPLSADHET